MDTRLVHPRVVVLVGLPGSGKSTWASKQNAAILSSDEIRYLLADDRTDQTIHATVFSTLRDLLRRRLQLQRPVTFVDATNLTPKERRPYIQIAQLGGAIPEAIFFDCPLSVCKLRNSGRSRQVPQAAMDLMAQRLVPPALDEGFAAVTCHRVEADRAPFVPS